MQMHNTNQLSAIYGINKGCYDWVFDSSKSRYMFQILLLTYCDKRPPRALYESTQTIKNSCKITSVVNKLSLPFCFEHLQYNYLLLVSFIKLMGTIVPRSNEMFSFNI